MACSERDHLVLDNVTSRNVTLPQNCLTICLYLNWMMNAKWLQTKQDSYKVVVRFCNRDMS